MRGFDIKDMNLPVLRHRNFLKKPMNFTVVWPGGLAKTSSTTVGDGTYDAAFPSFEADELSAAYGPAPSHYVSDPPETFNHWQSK